MDFYCEIDIHIPHSTYMIFNPPGTKQLEIWTFGTFSPVNCFNKVMNSNPGAKSGFLARENEFDIFQL